MDYNGCCNLHLLLLFSTSFYTLRASSSSMNAYWLGVTYGLDDFSFLLTLRMTGRVSKFTALVSLERDKSSYTIVINTLKGGSMIMRNIINNFTFNQVVMTWMRLCLFSDFCR